VPLPGLAQFQLLSVLDSGQHVVNTFHVVKPAQSTPPDLGQLGALAFEFNQWIGQTYLNLCSNRSTFTSITTQQVRDPKVIPTDVVLEYEFSIGARGTRPDGSGTVSAQEICGLIQYKTPNASRRFRGHNFLPPCLDDKAYSSESLLPASTYGVATTAWVAKLAAGVIDAQTRWTGGELSGWSLCCYSRAAAVQDLPYVANVSKVLASTRLRWLRSRARGTV